LSAALALFLLAGAAGASEKSPLVGSVVRSREYVVRREPREQEEFIGEVSYRRQARSVRADWALYDHESKRWKARGRIRGEDKAKDGGVFTCEGHEAEYAMGSGLGELRGKTPSDDVSLERRFPGRPSTETALGRVLSWDAAARKVTLSGAVRLQGPSGRGEADEAEYLHDEGVLRLFGARPWVAPAEAGWSSALQADSIRAESASRSIRAEGGVRGWLFFPERMRALR
jgi:hypothetical protein